jgi:two-component system sensor histidine kinase AlgZ
VLFYTVTNSKVSDSGKTVTEKSGIGLQNVKRRLELSYPADYELNVDENEKTYSVTLKLNLI